VVWIPYICGAEPYICGVDKLLFVSFQQNKPIGLFSNTGLNTLCIPHFSLKRKKLISQNL